MASPASTGGPPIATGQAYALANLPTVQCEFHGGPLAGQTLDIPEPLPPIIYAQVPMHLQTAWWTDPPEAEPMPEPVRYHLGRLRSGGYAYACWSSSARAHRPRPRPAPHRHYPDDPSW